MDVRRHSDEPERWTLVGFEHVNGGLRCVEGRPMRAGERVEVVPASQLAGAVEEIERLRRWIKVDGERQNSVRVVAQELERSERDFPTGGQYETSPASPRQRHSSEEDS